MSLFRDDAYDAPSAAECAADDFHFQVVEEIKQSEEYLELSERLEEADAAEYAVIEAEMEGMLSPTSDAYANVADALADAASYHADPYRYHGVSRSDFI